MQKCRWLICLSGAVWLGATSAFAAPAMDAENVRRQVGLKVGQWHTTIRITGAEATPATPGGAVPDNVRSELQKKIGTPIETDDCMGTRGSANGDLILPGISIAADCTLSNVHATTSSLALDSVCGSASGGFEARTGVQATISDTTMNARVQATILSRDSGIITHLTISTSSKYVGDCRLR
ncbi:DUF3617 family protein [Sphingomonas sp. AR_OL41]|uniref:DUF3617 domain-containing protein n=1 Tax=Sphingomonas sp. AR_OL41 TaxID=3042729 RepID=UPI00248097BB|nr:DUF3617 family protein [Sphingomonas sp. AR_OL41]MDH7971167.1 DUF3617 family protein [Sphingomonas sp. AR_OL41]